MKKTICALVAACGLVGCSPEKIPETKAVYQKPVENKDPCGRGSRILVSGLEYQIVDDARAVAYFAKPFGLVVSSDPSQPAFGQDGYEKLKIIAPKVDFSSDIYLSREEITDQILLNLAGAALEESRRQEIIKRTQAERRSWIAPTPNEPAE